MEKISAVGTPSYFLTSLSNSIDANLESLYGPTNQPEHNPYFYQGKRVFKPSCLFRAGNQVFDLQALDNKFKAFNPQAPSSRITTDDGRLVEFRFCQGDWQPDNYYSFVTPTDQCQHRSNMFMTERGYHQGTKARCEYSFGAPYFDGIKGGYG